MFNAEQSREELEDELDIDTSSPACSSKDADKRDIWWICEKDKKKIKPCFICGNLGHLGVECPNKYCSNCGQPGHAVDTCSKIPSSEKQCHRCGMKGHFSDGCPEIWRQYHHTTKNAPPVPKQAEDKGQSSAYCYNCAEKGHYGHACTKPRMSEGVFVHVPYINHYDTLEEIQRRQEERKGKAQKMQEIPASSTPPAQPEKKGRRKRKNEKKKIDGQHTYESQPS